MLVEAGFGGVTLAAAWPWVLGLGGVAGSERLALAALAGVVVLASGGGTNGECLAAVLVCPA